MTFSSQAEIHRDLPALAPRLLRFALVLTRRGDVAEDLVQDTILRMLENSAKYRSGTRLDRWALTIMVNLRRSNVRRLKPDQFLPVESAEAVEETRTPPADDSVFLRQTLLAIHKLPEAQRRAVMFVYIEGYTCEETANLTSVSPATVMSRLHAARKKLKALDNRG